MTSEGGKVTSVDIGEVKRKVKELYQRSKEAIGESVDVETDEEITELSWQEELLEILQGLPPNKFERLCQRMLRELGFLNVEVIGRAGDGGIDGKGVIRIGGVISFKVVFQCKRYKNSISPSFVRDFRGAMIGRADRGLLITTGVFTKEAVKEAQREGAPPIDLLDGYQFTEKLKDLGLGIELYTIEKVKINKEWFDKF